MTAGFDLRVDTDLLRAGAATMYGAGQNFLGAGRTIGGAVGPPIGSDDTARSITELVRMSLDRASGAAAQLGGIALTVSDHLRASAGYFDRADAALGAHGR